MIDTFRPSPEGLRRMRLGTLLAPPPASARPYFTTADWHWTSIPASPVIDPASATMIGQMANGADANVVLTNYEYGTPIYHIRDGDPAPPTYTLLPDYASDGPATSHTGGSTPNYGANPFAAVNPVPIPDAACHAAPAYATDPSTDAHLCVVDHRAGQRRVYALWKARKISGAWRCFWGGVASLDGVGNGDGSTGAGLSRLAGVVLTSDTDPGGTDLGHTLVGASAFTRATSSTDFRFPASKTDGLSNNAGGIPEGARLQLDPTLDVSGWPVGQQRILRTLQRFGLIVMDKSSDATLNIGMQANDPGQPGSPPNVASDPRTTVYGPRGYRSPTGFDAILSFPWASLRVLRQWDGG